MFLFRAIFIIIICLGAHFYFIDSTYIFFLYRRKLLQSLFIYPLRGLRQYLFESLFIYPLRGLHKYLFEILFIFPLRGLHKYLLEFYLYSRFAGCVCTYIYFIYIPASRVASVLIREFIYLLFGRIILFFINYFIIYFIKYFILF